MTGNNLNLDLLHIVPWMQEGAKYIFESFEISDFFLIFKLYNTDDQDPWVSWNIYMWFLIFTRTGSD